MARALISSVLCLASAVGCSGGSVSEPAPQCVDLDRDGFGDGSTCIAADCNDQNAAIHPGAAEVYYNGLDDDCDARSDDTDQDGDGHAALGIGGDDCDDNDGAINPAALEIAGNTVDEDCSGAANDIDGDGFDAIGNGGGDCDDNDGAINPAALEIAGNTVDEDCSGAANDIDGDGFDAPANGGGDCDDGDGREYPGVLWYADRDGDGFGDPAATPSPCERAVGTDVDNADDCDDTPGAGALVHPSAIEGIADGVDQNCDGEEWCYEDLDDDGFGTLATVQITGTNCGATAGVADNSNDCEDASPSAASIHPGAAEVINDGVDQDCNGAEGCYEDLDGDGFGSLFEADDPDSDFDCTTGAGVSPVSTDCDDGVGTGGSIYPGAPELPADGVDSSCDGIELCFEDLDGDTYGTLNTLNGVSGDLLCTGAGVADDSLDCDDDPVAGPAFSPAVAELLNDGVDQNCDGRELCYLDADGDTYGAVAQATGGTGDLLCTGVGVANNSADCLDSDPLHWADCGACADADLDGRGVDCDLGVDCDDSDPNNWISCMGCVDADFDGAHGGCDDYVGLVWDCDDADPTVYAGATVELPDDGIGQDCVGPDLKAADGNGIYVDGSDAVCNDALPGTIATPNCTVGGAVGHAAGIGPVFVAAGTYNESIVSDVSLFGGYAAGSGWTRDPIANVTTLIGTAQSTVQIPSGAGVVAVQGFDIFGATGVAPVGIDVLGSAYIADNDVNGGTSAAGTTIGVAISGSATVARNRIDGGSGGSAIAIANRGGNLTALANPLISSLGGTGATALVSADPGGSALVVANSIYGDPGAVSTGNGSTMFLDANRVDGCVLATGGLVATNNVITPRDAGPPLGEWALYLSGDNMTAAFNTILDGPAANTRAILAEGDANVIIGNNIDAGVASGAGSAGLYVRSAATNITFVGNNFASPPDCLVRIENASLCISQLNLPATPAVNTCSDWGSTCVASSNNRNTSPAFIDTAQHLSPASLLIDAGIDPTAYVSVAADFEGDPRPAGSTWDIGADERRDRRPGHLVISEVGRDLNNQSACDYVELYNPTVQPLSLNGMSVQRGLASPGTITRVDLPNVVVPPYSFYLVGDNNWATAGCDGTALLDRTAATDFVINDDDVIFLVAGQNDVASCRATAIVDRVAFGINGCGEGETLPNTPTRRSVERRAHQHSAAADMRGGVDAASGNSQDRDDNAGDFVVHAGIDEQEPQNAASPAEMP